MASSSANRALVVGHGSIGQRHARLLADLGLDVSIVSRRQLPIAKTFASIEQALADGAFGYVVVANETSEHAAAVQALRTGGHRGKVLIEKPVTSSPADIDGSGFAMCAVGYNLRFHPVLAALSDALAGQTILSMQIYCGQYLPTWREGRDYREAYSAHDSQGGGALRDLSHELDYALWLGGRWKRVVALGGHVSSLNIRSDDSLALLLELDGCPMATLQVNYLDRPGRRDIVVNTDERTFHADLIGGTLETDGVLRRFPLDRDRTMLDEHRAVLADDRRRLCSLAEGARVVALVDAAFRSANERCWIAA